MVGKSENGYERWVAALLIASLFAAISWLAPAMYLGMLSAPSDHVQINSVSINQTDDQHHNVSIEYWGRDKYPIEAEITLFQEQNKSDNAIEQWTVTRVVPAGESERAISLRLNQPLPPGEYYYEFDLTVHVGYNIERQYVYQTDAFPVSDSGMLGYSVDTEEIVAGNVSCVRA